MKYLLLLDVNKIKDYLFASVRLRQIVNASALLADVNERQTRELVEKEGGTMVCSAGGLTQAVFSDRQKAEECARQLIQLYPDQTVTATAVAHVEPWDKGNETFASAISRGMGKVRQLKGGSPVEAMSQPEYEQAPSPGGSPFFRICAQTGQEYATKWETPPGEAEDAEFGPGSWIQHDWQPETGAKAKLTEYAFTAALPSGKEVLFRAAQGDRLEVDVLLRHRLAHDIGEEPGHFGYPFDFDRLAIPSTPANYIGFMDADGNGMGECHLTLSEKEASQDEYTAFSQLLSESTREAFVEAAAHVLWPQKFKIIPLRVLIMGGDDVLVVAQPQYILPLANEFCRRFQQIALRRRQKLIQAGKCPAIEALPPLTMSAGVVIAHKGFPFLSFKRLGEKLLKSAKKRAWAARRDGEGSFGSVDFQVITASGIDDLKTLRRDAYTLHYSGEPEVRLTGRPYLVSPDCDELRDLRKVAGLLRTIQEGAPRGQVKGLHDILRRGFQRGQIDFQRWLMRLGGDRENPATRKIRELLNSPGPGGSAEWPSPWLLDTRPGGDGKCYTPLLDVVELFDLRDELPGEGSEPTQQEKGESQ